MTRLRYNNAVGLLGAPLGAASVGAIGFDSASPNNTHYSGGNMITNPFNAPAGSTVLAIMFGWSSGATYSISDNSGGALTWTGYGNNTGGLDSVAIYTAKVGGAISGLVVNCYAGPNTAAWVFVLDNVDNAGMGAQATNSNSTSISLTTTKANSLVFACHADHASAGAPSGFGSGQSNTMNGAVVSNTSGGFAQCAWYTTSPQALGANVSMSYTGGGGAVGFNIAVEILNAAGTVPTAITFAVAPSFPTLSGGDYIPLILDPPSGSTPNPNFEIVYLTSYVSGTTSGTVTRAQEGTTVQSHAAGCIWVCGQTAGDVVSVPTVQVFTGPGTYTWTKPPGITMVNAIAIGAGGGGGSGRRGAAGTVRCGGGGGGSGSYSSVIVPASICNPTETVVVGTPGVGGAAQTANDTDGIAGSATSTTSYFGAAGHGHVVGGGGTSGGAGTASSGTNGLAGGGMAGGTAGGTASTTGGVGGNGGPAAGASGGAAGGGITSSDVAANGGTGGQSYMNAIQGGGIAGTIPGGNGGNGFSRSSGDPGGGCGGGGGAASVTGAAGSGGNGGNYGAGGGGGGASLNGNNSGKGGDGAPGIVVVSCW